MKIIITGATGMVGEGVLMECLQRPDVEKVLSLQRRDNGMKHPKLEILIHSDFSDCSSIASRFEGYDACLFCAGVSAIGKTKEEYFRLTYTLTMHIASLLADKNPGMTFCYISGSSTDSSEKGRMMWARVKGKTENDLMKLPFKHVYAFRPGYLHPTPGQKHVLGGYTYVSWLFPVFKLLIRNYVSTIRELAIAMIEVSKNGYEKSILEVKDILKVATRNR